MRNNRYKRGTTVLNVAITLCIGVILLSVFLAFSINCFMPLILQQKLQMISTKYMYIIEKYGYFTKEEKAYLMKELEQGGFNMDKVIVEAPEIPKKYGETIEFNICYTYVPMQFLGMENKIINVKRVSYAKM